MRPTRTTTTPTRKDPFAIALGKRLQEAAEDMGWTSEEAARQLRIPRPTWLGYTSGNRTYPCRRIRQAARIFRKPISFFFGTHDPEALSGRERSCVMLLREMDESTQRDWIRVGEGLAAASERRRQRAAPSREGSSGPRSAT